MRCIVLGAGVVGVTTAWYLARAGHQVTVIERQSMAAMETSFANGGQISVCHAEPWANPKAPIKMLQWLGDDDAPLLFKFKFDWAQWWWGLQFLRECTPDRARRNLQKLVRLGLYSRMQLQQLRAETHIQYDQLAKGILHYYTEESEFESAVKAARSMREAGLDREVKTTAECLDIEPALNNSRINIVGGTYTPSDESGDARKFTQELAALCRQAGVMFRYETSVDQLLYAGRSVNGVAISWQDETGSRKEVLEADAYIVCLGSYSPLLLRDVGIKINLYPAKGYSATVPVGEEHDAPSVAMTDDGCKIVYSRLGDRLRIAGTAEFNGYNLDLTLPRCQALIKRARDIFPNGADFDAAEFWTGLRPSTPSNLPYIGAVGEKTGLWLNTGHGTLGWTESCGSGRILADMVSGNAPEMNMRG